MQTNYNRGLYQSQFGAVPLYIAEEAHEEASFLGIGKKAAARRAEKKETKQANKLVKIEARGNARAKVAAAGGGLAGLGAGLGGIVGKVTEVLGGGGSAAPVDSSGTYAPAGSETAGAGTEKKSKTGLFIGIGIAVVLVIVVIVIVKKKKKG